MSSYPPEMVDELDDAVRDAIDRVLSAHGCMRSEYVGMVNFIGTDGKRAFSTFVDEDQLHSQTRSMVQFLYEYNTEVARLEIQQMLSDE